MAMRKWSLRTFSAGVTISPLIWSPLWRLQRMHDEFSRTSILTIGPIDFYYSIHAR